MRAIRYPEDWIGQEVRITLVSPGSSPENRYARLRDANELGITVENLTTRTPSFIPWSAVREIQVQGGTDPSA